MSFCHANSSWFAASTDLSLVSGYHQSGLEKFDRYVMNDVPIQLIRLSDMKDYHPSQTVKYAILSHRRLDEGELTYEEMKNGTAAGPEYEKLKKFCEKAKVCDVEFVRSDTCCIDESSSTELDDSIRFMYQWYRHETICIAHLAQSETMEAMMGDEWMLRG
ncbi:hypothetical protein DFH29DRAFT_993060 [Suillus ampliporus]|nr:hypothetical protein DFH29DRAFT_993060 [Suillus ampliporus]